MLHKNPYTTAELFNIIDKKLKENGMLPGILDYGLPEHSDIQIKSYEWDLIGIVNFGGSEGIYLDLYCYGNTGNEKDKIPVGTYKTLERSREAYKTMGALCADFVYECFDFVNGNMEDFTWKGYGVYAAKNKQVSYVPIYDVSDWTRAKQYAEKLAKGENVEKIVIKDYTLRKETEYPVKDGCVVIPEQVKEAPTW